MVSMDEWRRPLRITSLVVICTAVLFNLGCRDIYTVDRWIGMNESDMTELLGKPTTEYVIKLSSATRLYEYQSNLSKIVPVLNNKEVEIKEMQWKSVDKTVTVWLQKNGGTWKVIDTLIWSKDVKF